MAARIDWGDAPEGKQKAVFDLMEGVREAVAERQRALDALATAEGRLSALQTDLRAAGASSQLLARMQAIIAQAGEGE